MQLFKNEKKIKLLTKASALLCGLVLVPLMAFSNADEVEKADDQAAPKRLNPFLMQKKPDLEKNENPDIPGAQKRPNPFLMPKRPDLEKAENPDQGALKRPNPFMPEKPDRMGQRPKRAMPAPPLDEEMFRVSRQPCRPAKGEFVWNFEDEQLINILKQISDLLCISIVVNDTVNQNLKLTIIGKTPMTAKDAWAVLLASLQSKGLALVEQGKTWTVIKRNESRNFASPFYDRGDKASNDEGIGTLFYKAKHNTPETLKNISKLLVSKDGMVETISDQFIIVIDSNSNLRRLQRIFDEIDIEDAANKVHVIMLTHGDAKTIEAQLTKIFDITPGRGARAKSRTAGESSNRGSVNIDKIISDERLNAIILVGDAEAKKSVENVIALLDQPANEKPTKGNIHVKRLRYADAEQVAQTINEVAGQGKNRPRFPRRRPDEETNQIFEGEVKVTAHKETNTVVTVATPGDYASVLATINRLDSRKDQVYLEAAILDISVNDTNEFGLGLFSGVQGPQLPGIGGTLGILANPGGQSIASGISTAIQKDASGTSNIGGLGTKSVGALAVLGNFLSGGIAGFVGDPVVGSTVPSFGAVLKAISTSSNVDVLSTPYLLTTDNKEAVMSVGEKVPVIRGASTMGGGAASGLGIPIQNINYEDVKLTFKITPHVGDEGNVRLDIDQEVNELGGKENLIGATQHRINTKSAKTTIVLKDQQTGVIGGLISHKSQKSDSKIPFLGDIPLLGWLFKSRDSKNERKSLLLIITPYIIRTDEDYKKILERKMKEREEFARLYYGGKIRSYNPHIDYDKKAGPLGNMIISIDNDMQKRENFGQGTSDETIITPKSKEPAAPMPFLHDASGALDEMPAASDASLSDLALE